MTKADIANALCFQPYELSISETGVSPQDISEALSTLDSFGIPMDDDQKSAINNSLSKVLTLLWGPAGTGKTDTVANYIAARILMVDKYGTVNVVIGSNNYGAIDNLLAKVIKKLKLISPSIPTQFFRVKSSSADDFFDQEISKEGIKELSPTSQGQEDKDAREMIDALNDKGINCVVAGTWKQLTKISANRVEWFDICVIDEATQLNTIAALAYFTMLKNTANVTVAGDYRQLGTIYAYDNDLEAGIYDSIFNYYRNDHIISMQKLNKTYRSNEYVAAWPRVRFYENVYEAHFRDKKASYAQTITSQPIDWPETLMWDDNFIQVLDPNNPIVVIIHDESTSTLSNHFESDLLIALNHLLQISYETTPEDYWNNKVGIVSPHRAQNSLIRNKLIQSGLVDQNDPLAINTVDSFQGKQREVILNSYVVSDPDFIQREEEFILDDRRFNVTLTRAESKFIMLISSSLIRYLSNDPKVAEKASHLQMFAKLYCSSQVGNFNIEHRLEDGSINTVNCQIRVPS